MFGTGSHIRAEACNMGTKKPLLSLKTEKQNAPSEITSKLNTTNEIVTKLIR